ncbi:MAG TPA: GNAT family N-acetyltransferase [Candidatus Saccharimonadales bacterium]
MPDKLPPFYITPLRSRQDALACAALLCKAYIDAYEEQDRQPGQPITDFVRWSGFLPRKIDYLTCSADREMGTRAVRHRAPHGQRPIVGFCIGSQYPGNPTEMHLDGIFMNAAFRRYGLAACLLGSMPSDYPQWQIMRTETTQGTAAVRFFERLGFVATNKYIPPPPEPYAWNGTILPQVEMVVRREELEASTLRRAAAICN